MLHKSFTLLETKAEGDSGEFTALVSTFGNVDRVGDRIMPGAYTKTLEEWRVTGDPIPIILAHQWSDPMAHIGVADAKNVVETEKGLLVKGKLDVEDNPVARQVYKLMKRRSLKEFSIGYSVPEGGEKRAKDGANEINTVTLAECGPCLKGIDPKTELHDVKAALGVEDLQEPATEQELRRRSDLVDRTLKASQLPETMEEPAPDPVEELTRQLDDAKARNDLLTGALQADRTFTGKRLASDIREQLDAAGVKRFATGQDTYSYVDDFDPDQGWAVFYISPKDGEGRRFVKVDYSVNGQGSIVLGDTETEVVRTTTFRPKSGPAEQPKTGEGPSRARSVDELRRRSEQAVLEIQSDGASLRKPPQVKRETKAEPPSEAELKRRSRDAMLALLTGEPA